MVVAAHPKRIYSCSDQAEGQEVQTLVLERKSELLWVLGVVVSVPEPELALEVLVTPVVPARVALELLVPVWVALRVVEPVWVPLGLVEPVGVALEPELVEPA